MVPTMGPQEAAVRTTMEQAIAAGASAAMIVATDPAAGPRVDGDEERTALR